MRTAVCVFVMLDVLITTSSMDTEYRQLRMVNRLTEVNPKPNFNNENENPDPTHVKTKVGAKPRTPLGKAKGRAKAGLKSAVKGDLNPTDVKIKVGAKPFMPPVGPKIAVKGQIGAIKPVPEEMGSPVAPKAKVTGKAKAP